MLLVLLVLVLAADAGARLDPREHLAGVVNGLLPFDIPAAWGQGVLMVSLPDLCERLCIDMTVNSGAYSLSRAGHRLEFTPGRRSAIVDGVPILLSARPVISGSVFYMALKDLARTFDLRIPAWSEPLPITDAALPCPGRDLAAVLKNTDDCAAWTSADLDCDGGLELYFLFAQRDGLLLAQYPGPSARLAFAASAGGLKVVRLADNAPQALIVTASVGASRTYLEVLVNEAGQLRSLFSIHADDGLSLAEGHPAFSVAAASRLYDLAQHSAVHRFEFDVGRGTFVETGAVSYRYAFGAAAERPRTPEIAAILYTSAVLLDLPDEASLYTFPDYSGLAADLKALGRHPGWVRDLKAQVIAEGPKTGHHVVKVSVGTAPLITLTVAPDGALYRVVEGG
jgi:hypothetical protein